MLSRCMSHEEEKGNERGTGTQRDEEEREKRFRELVSDVIGGMGTNAMLLHFEHRFKLWWCNIKEVACVFMVYSLSVSRSPSRSPSLLSYWVFFYSLSFCSVVWSPCSINTLCTIRNANQYLLHAAFQQGYLCRFGRSKLNMFTLFVCSVSSVHIVQAYHA